MRRNNHLRDNAGCVKEDVLSVLGILRHAGHTTLSGLHRIAMHCGVPSRRTRTIAFEDQTYTATDEQRRHMALSIADLFDKLADDFEKRAEACRQKGDAIRLRERQQLSLALGGNTWRSGNMSAQHSGVPVGRLAA